MNFSRFQKRIVADKVSRSLMGNDNKTVRSKINTLTVLCENLWPI